MSTRSLSALQAARLGRGLSRQRLGALAGGISIATITRIERGQVRRPHPATLHALARALRREPEALFPIFAPDENEIPAANGDPEKLGDATAQQQPG